MARFRQVPVGLLAQWFDGKHPEVAGLWVLLMTDPRAEKSGCFRVSRAEIWGELGMAREVCEIILGDLHRHVIYEDRWVALRRFPEYQGKGAKWMAGVSDEIKHKRVPPHLAAFALGEAWAVVETPVADAVSKDTPSDAPSDTLSDSLTRERERERGIPVERERGKTCTGHTMTMDDGQT